MHLVKVPRWVVTIVLAVPLVVTVPVIARAQSVSPSPSPAVVAPVPAHPADQVVLSGTALVPKGVTVGEVVVVHGRAQIAGAVHGDVVVLDGPVTVMGAYITGSVVTLNGPIRITGAAQIGGDVLGADTVRVEAGAKIGGDVREQVGFTLQGQLAALGALVGAIAMAFSVLLLGGILLLIAPRGGERVAAAIKTAPFASAGWGLLLAIVVPVAAVAAVASVVGLPLGLTLLLALSFFVLLGLTWTAWGIGRAIVRPPRSRGYAFLVGWAIVAILGLVPLLNLAVWGLGSIFGVGAMLVAAWRARGTGKGRHRVGSPQPEMEDEPVLLPPSAPSSWTSS